MRLITTAIVFLLFSVSVQAQILTLTDAETQEPLEMATISSNNPRAATITNVKGQAEVSDFKGAEEIEIRVVGYSPLIISYSSLADLNYQVKLISSKVNLDEVVVSVTRWRQKTSEIPSQVVSISPKTINLQNPQTTADLLGLSGKVFIQKSQQGGGSPIIRGFSTNRLLYSVDGVRMNTAIFRGGNIQNVISLDPFAIEHTEVLFGPGSIIYGSDAIGGVMNFQTLSPQLSLNNKSLHTGSAVLRYSSVNNEKTGHFDINMGWKKWAMVTSITSYDFGDLKMGTKGPDEYLRPFYVERHDTADVVVGNSNPYLQVPTGYTQMNIMQKVLFKATDHWTFNYGFHYSETSNYSRYDRHIRYRNGRPRYGEWDYGPQKWMMNNLSASYSSSKLFFDKLTAQIAYQQFEESRISRDFNAIHREIKTEEVDAYSLNLDFIKSASSGITIFYGIEGIQNNVHSRGIEENIVTKAKNEAASRYPESVWATYAAYLSAQFKLSEKFHLHSGMRYNQYMLHADFDTSFYPLPFTTADINDGALTGSLGVVYKLTSDWLISTNASTAFRSPNVDDIGKVFDSEPGSVTVPNPDLKAEYAYNVDVSVTKLLSDIAKIDITAFYTYLDNALVRRDYSLGSNDSILYLGEESKVQAIQNAASSEVYGLQGSLELKLPYGFGFSADYNYQHGEEELDNGSVSPSRHAPPWFGVARVTYSAQKLFLKVYTDFSGEKSFDEMPVEEISKDYMYASDKNGNPYSPAWYTLNFKAMYYFSPQFTVSVGLENITDQLYRPYSSGIVAPGRNFIFSVKMKI